MVSEKQERVRKLNWLKQHGINPYAYNFKRSHYTADILKRFRTLRGKTVKVCGRIRSIRSHGKASFFDLEDCSGKVQVLIKLDDVKPMQYEIFKHFDIGDIIGIDGTVIKSKTGEITICTKKIELLTKCLHPLPSKWHGLRDVEERYRKRYLDLIVNPNVKNVFIMRSKIIEALREFFKKRDYIEVETPIMQPIYGGGLARPFITHHNSLKKDMYLRISNELYLKRLIVGGFERVVEFSVDFRNEGIDTTHNPEFLQLEAMTAYYDYKDSMKLFEEMVEYVAKKVLGTTKLTYQGKTINLKAPWKRISLVNSLKKYADIDVNGKSAKELKEVAKKKGIGILKGAQRGEIVAALFEELVEGKLIQPTIIYDYPWEVSPLAKRCRNNPKFTERFEVFIAGAEFGNNYTELNDPAELRKNFIEQLGRAEAGDEEAHPMDTDFIEAMEYAMPPTSGIGLGVDRLVMLFTNSNSIRDVILFPQLRERGMKPSKTQIFGDEIKDTIIKKKR